VSEQNDTVWKLYKSTTFGVQYIVQGNTLLCEVVRDDGDFCDDILREMFRILNTHEELITMLADTLSEWRYIRKTYGDLYGVGWDRVENALQLAVKNT